MSDPLIHACDDYIVIEPGEKEKILNSTETLEWIENWLKKFKAKNRDKRLVISLNPSVAEYINTNKSKIITGMMWSNWTFLTIEGDHNININDFKVFSKKRNEYVTKQV